MNSLTELLQARRSEHRVGLRWSGSGEWASYAEILRGATCQAATLRRIAEPGQRVLLVADNGPELVSALLACWWAGCTPCCWPPPHRLQHAASYNEALSEAIQGADIGLAFAAPRCLAHCHACAVPGGWRPLPIEEGADEAPAGPPVPIAYLQFSSGTTRRPRPTVLSQENLTSNLRAIASQMPQLPSGNSGVSWLPFYHDMGLIGCLLSALWVPGDLTVMTPTQFALRPGRWLDEIHQHRATITAAPNFALEQLLHRDANPGSAARDLSCLQRLWLGAETVRPATLRAFYARYRHQGLSWGSLRPVYGLAEATLAVTFSAGPRIENCTIPTQLGGAIASGPRELLSLGQPLPGVRLEVRDEAGTVMPERHLGLIHVDGPGVAKNAGRPFNTGDVGFLSDGELFFVTRAKDVLIYHGRNHDPEGVECLIHPLEAAVVDVEDEGAVCLAERPRDPETSDGQLLDELRRRLSHAALPVQPVLVERGWLPRTSSGKISRQQARRKYAELYEP
jgi:fatty-acyl-CoA synthase